MSGLPPKLTPHSLPLDTQSLTAQQLPQGSSPLPGTMSGLIGGITDLTGCKSKRRHQHHRHSATRLRGNRTKCHGEDSLISQVGWRHELVHSRINKQTNMQINKQ